MQKLELLDHFIVFEGLDGAGTTTQAKRLLDTLLRNQRPAVLHNEPTPGPIGKLIRAYLSGEISCHPDTLAALFAADRREHIYGAGGVLDELKAGKTVICDRYLFSSLAYQSLDSTFSTVFSFNKEFPLPRLLFFFDISPEVCEKRIASRGSREIFETLELQRRVRDKYEQILSRYSDSGMEIVRLDGGMDINELSSLISSTVL